MEMCVSPIDSKHFSATTGDDPEFAAELLAVFIEDTAERLEHMQQLLNSGNLSEIKRVAHHIRGSSANVGCFAMQAIAKDMELNDHTVSELQAMCVQLQEILQQVKAYAESLTATGS
jgi:HPt (histidine-containing phosphotransfer) domain-containing protein